ncbi:hypothetical protein [Ammoniphilus sp. CFH 90114]|uniref:hypothetical protein n=1 Tax=Ammoniphilus sp. CFH 90114 TaxID=2493665 RepID=UPI00100FEC55|nr:hypothetical protein [Ammoniphilus sp. CFH 90114]RXT08154.1 hypothetical protein EIZ39_12195 [Ammoniphilus sp. CFH 90114]
MENKQARMHVQKGLFALITGFCLIILYQYLEVTSWLHDVDNVVVTMFVVIVPLIIATEMLFQLYHYFKPADHKN